jgi:hypothetical protein
MSQSLTSIALTLLCSKKSVTYNLMSAGFDFFSEFRQYSVGPKEFLEGKKVNPAACDSEPNVMHIVTATVNRFLTIPQMKPNEAISTVQTLSSNHLQLYTLLVSILRNADSRTFQNTFIVFNYQLMYYLNAIIKCIMEK